LPSSFQWVLQSSIFSCHFLLLFIWHAFSIKTIYIFLVSLFIYSTFFIICRFIICRVSLRYMCMSEKDNTMKCNYLYLQFCSTFHSHLKWICFFVLFPVALKLGLVNYVRLIPVLVVYRSTDIDSQFQLIFHFFRCFFINVTRISSEESVRVFI